MNSTPPAAGALSTHWIAVMPFVFVFLWSTGFLVAKFGLPYAPPLTFLLLRFLFVLVLMVPLVLLMRAPWPRGRILHIALAGALLHAGYVGGVWTAINLGMPAGLAALIVGLQPIFTALAAPMVGESVRMRQWMGLVLGLVGVLLVVSNKISLIGLSGTSLGLAIVALCSITVGALYQKRFCPQFDLRTGTVIQFASSALVVLPFAIFFEDLTPAFTNVQWTPSFIGALLWAVLAISIGAIFLLFGLIRREAATSLSSYLYLTPPTTALMAWLMFNETFSLIGMAGMLLAIVGVYFVVRKA
ncbi:MAG: DMT family transporter [Lacisediminimonas sp.]|nr:DMT family transporter [Lacisediminimonas sp.]